MLFRFARPQERSDLRNSDLRQQSGGPNLLATRGNRSGDDTWQWVITRELGIHRSDPGPLRLSLGPLDWGSGIGPSYGLVGPGSYFGGPGSSFAGPANGFGVPALVL